MGQISFDGVSQLGERQRLQPDAAGAGEGGQKNSVAAEDHVLDSWNRRDLKRHTRLKSADVPGMNAESLSRAKVSDHKFARQFQPGHALSAKFLQQEAVAAEDSRAQRLLEAYADLNLRSRTKKTMAVNHVFLGWPYLKGNDVSRHFCGEGQFSRGTGSSVFRHEQSSATGHAFQHTENSSASAELGMRGHLDRTRHPG